MFFSIIIPTCNRNNLLALCLNKLQIAIDNCPEKAIEVIVTDDSKEGIAQQVIENKYNWVQWIKGPQKGPAANRNSGAKQAKGEWLVFLDDDCEPDKIWLQSYNEAVRKHSFLVYEGVTLCNEGFTSPLHWAPINKSGGKLWSCNFVIAKSIFFKLEGFDENFPFPHMEDNDLAKRLKDSGYKFSFVQNAIVNHPPRLLSSPKKMAMLQESLFYFNRKHKIKSIKKYQLIKSVITLHLSLIKNNFFSKHFFKALILLSGIVYYLNRYIPIWQKKYV